MRLSLRAALAAAFAVAALPVPASAGDPLPFRVPAGYRVTARDEIAPGIEHVRLESRHPLHVVDLGLVRKRSGYRVDVRHAGPRSRGSDRRLEGTSELCGDDCAYATNGDYAFRQPSRVVGRPIGGIVERGVVLVSPDTHHQQASYTYDGDFTTARLRWSARVTSGRRALTVTGKNVPRAAGQLVLYTPDYVRATGTDAAGAELTVRVERLRPDEPQTARLVAFRDRRGNAAVRPGFAVLSGSGRGAAALRRLWAATGPGAQVEIAETLAPGNVWASVGGGHILIRNGRRWLAPENAPHLTATHPRTFAGVLADGTLLHATVDGRDRNEGRSVGMPLEEAVRFFTALGAREVINMDGGGSTTFVKQGRIVNRPSDGRERPVTTAMVVVRGRLPRPAPALVVPKPRPGLPEPPPAGVRYAAAPDEVPPVPLAVWVAIGNILAMTAALTTVWVRHGRRPAVA